MSPIRSQTPEARKLPIPAPLCNSPPPLPRARSGHTSETSEAPVTHSEPMPMPTRKRRIAKDSQFHAMAERPVVSVYARTASLGQNLPDGRGEARSPPTLALRRRRRPARFRRLDRNAFHLPPVEADVPGF